MATEMHGALGCDMDRFIRECTHLFYDRRLGSHLSLSFCIYFLRQCVCIAFQHALTCAIEKKISLASDVCSKPSITIKFHDLHASDIRRVVGEMTSYHEKD
jgi:hypothetical protein